MQQTRMGIWSCLLTCIAACLAPSAAFAQNGVMISGDNMAYSVPDYGSIALTQSYLESTKRQMEKRSGRSSAPKPSVAKAQPKLAPTALRDARVRYDAAVTQSMKREYLGNLAKRLGAGSAEAIGAYFEEHPLHTQFDAIAAPYGLGRSDLADVVTTYFLVMWTTANQASPPTRAQAQALRTQLGNDAGRQVAVPGDPVKRQRVAESIMYKLVQMTMLRDEMRKRGDPAAMRKLADTAQRDLLAEGVDLRATQLTSAGFVAR